MIYMIQAPKQPGEKVHKVKSQIHLDGMERIRALRVQGEVQPRISQQEVGGGERIRVESSTSEAALRVLVTGWLASVLELGKSGLGLHVRHIVRIVRDFPGDPVVKTSSFQCRGTGFNPCSGN